MSIRLASILFALCAAFTTGGDAQATALPGSAELPLAAGSEIVACENITASSVCVSMPNDNTRGPILDSYQHALQERGFSLRESASSVGLFLRPAGDICEAVTVEPLYVTVDERGSVVVFEFEYHREPADQCQQ